MLGFGRFSAGGAGSLENRMKRSPLADMIAQEEYHTREERGA